MSDKTWIKINKFFCFGFSALLGLAIVQLHWIAIPLAVAVGITFVQSDRRRYVR